MAPKKIFCDKCPYGVRPKDTDKAVVGTYCMIRGMTLPPNGGCTLDKDYYILEEDYLDETD